MKPLENTILDDFSITLPSETYSLDKSKLCNILFWELYEELGTELEGESFSKLREK